MDPRDVVTGFPVGWNTAKFSDAMWPGVVGGKGKIDVLKCSELRQKIARSTVKVLRHVGAVHAQLTGGGRHELAQAVSAFRARGCWAIGAFCFDEGLEQTMPIICRRDGPGAAAVCCWAYCSEVLRMASSISTDPCEPRGWMVGLLYFLS